jgi:parallel beta-helix repeat protein
MKKLVSGMMLTLLLLGTLTLTLNIGPAKSSPATITVPDDYATIQAAINAANSGDTIYVRNGIYQEYMEVNKTVTLTGESNQNTTIESLGIQITANNTVIENFHIIGPNTYLLVMIDGRASLCSNNTIRNNTFMQAHGGDNGGLDILTSESNTVASNLIVIGNGSDHGIALLYSSNHNTIDNNTITGGWVSIYCDFSDSNVFSNNHLADQTSTYAPVNGIGALTLAFTEGDIVRGNTFIHNDIGFSAPWGIQTNFCIYNNNFINNTQQVLVRSGNQITFDKGYPSGGNYWTDYSGVDSFCGAYQNKTGSDGIGDTPYAVDASNIDHYPLMKPCKPVLPGDSARVLTLGDLNLTLANFTVSAPSQISNFTFDQTISELGFEAVITQADEISGNTIMITLPSEVLNDPSLTVTSSVDGKPNGYIAMNDTTIAFLPLLPPGTHTVTLIIYDPTTSTTPEFQGTLILTLFILMSLAVVILKKRLTEKFHSVSRARKKTKRSLRAALRTVRLFSLQLFRVQRLLEAFCPLETLLMLRLLC